MIGKAAKDPPVKPKDDAGRAEEDSFGKVEERELFFADKMHRRFFHAPHLSTSAHANVVA